MLVEHSVCHEPISVLINVCIYIYIYIYIDWLSKAQYLPTSFALRFLQGRDVTKCWHFQNRVFVCYQI